MRCSIWSRLTVAVWLSASLGVLACRNAAGAEEVAACPEPQNQREIDDARKRLSAVATEDAQKDLSQKELEARFVLRDAMLARGECDTGEHDAAIFALVAKPSGLGGIPVSGPINSSDTAILGESNDKTQDEPDTLGGSVLRLALRFLTVLLDNYERKSQAEIPIPQGQEVISLEPAPVPAPSGGPAPSYSPPPPPPFVLRGTVRGMPRSVSAGRSAWDQSVVIPTVKVSVAGSGREAPTNSQGEFAVSGRGSRVINLVVSAEGYQTGRMQVFVPPGETRKNFLLRRIDQGDVTARIQGTVKGARQFAGTVVRQSDWNNAEPIRATVRVVEWSREELTDGNGRFSIPGPAGRGSVTLVVTPREPVYNSTMVHPARGDEAKILLTRAPQPGDRPQQGALPAVLYGMIKTGNFAGATPTLGELAAMRPLPGIAVRISQWNQTDRTRADGTFRLQGRSGNVTLEIQTSRGVVQRALQLSPGDSRKIFYIRP